ncbi:SecDF P1 head subdomain-containing protein [Luteimonas salinilitoris]|uniref:SecDF P1 head subdomain domain-containing protein n=1 Tax=Luteimonas salinilitoris TaxID=3237697 RepID=A0ABV4HQ30_9GAMM
MRASQALQETEKVPGTISHLSKPHRLFGGELPSLARRSRPSTVARDALAAMALVAVFAVAGCTHVNREEASVESEAMQPVRGDVAFHLAAEPGQPDAMTLPMLRQDDADTSVLALQPVPVVEGTQVASVDLGLEDGEFATLDLRLTGEGARRLRMATAENVGKRLAVVAGGRVISVATIMAEIPGGEVRISELDVSDAKKLYETMTLAE